MTVGRAPAAGRVPRRRRGAANAVPPLGRAGRDAGTTSWDAPTRRPGRPRARAPRRLGTVAPSAVRGRTGTGCAATWSGTVVRTVEIALDAGDTVRSQTNCMCWMDDTVATNTDRGGRPVRPEAQLLGRQPLPHPDHGRRRRARRPRAAFPRHHHALRTRRRRIADLPQGKLPLRRKIGDAVHRLAERVAAGDALFPRIRAGRRSVEVLQELAGRADDVDVPVGGGGRQGESQGGGEAEAEAGETARLAARPLFDAPCLAMMSRRRGRAAVGGPGRRGTGAVAA